ncbi:tubulin-like doman-containing protein [Evansella tamaricis]|uniref:Tubulin-like doman-containing protein n=1 Tax=Evansella tamaricis TaxID=2069301 RepID=A0ABS6JL13_9BACI|nr:tubulin-like doman-containing protein [Evansella tamaricis]MBU9714376.1 tubulin-like doman-containing protein [Evansella tamaricis]
MANGVPTILVGLGGMGSGVVNEIYGNIPLESRGNVAIHAFDTDVNTIRQMEHLTDNITQTSTKKSVGEYLHQNPSLLKWFPDNPTLRKKNMTQGAGQVRAVSRLAFRSAMDEKKLNSLEESIDRIFPVTSEKLIHGVRVIIISSLAGGTGSGIFLQVAMYLRELLEKKFGQSSVLIRGAFLLPDILVRTNTIDQREWESVRANGYASLKELNAITQSASGQLKNEEDVTIELEYRPGQVDLLGRTTHAVTDRQLPYDFCFLYDYENLSGQNLPSASEYVDQMSRTIFLQLFSPISLKHFSQEDNQILELISSEGKARYCGAGAATLIYPYKDVLEYCSLRWSVSGLDESWLVLDKLYEEERQRYENDLRRGINRERPDRGERYRWNLEQFVNDEKPNPFFKQAFNQTREELPQGKQGDSKAKLFIDAVKDRIDTVLQQDQELGVFENNCRVDEGKMKLKNYVKREIGEMEAHLKMYKDQINKKVYEYRTFLSHQVIDQDADSPDGAEGQEFRLNTWFLKKDKPVHPVAVRYMLYEIKAILQEETAKLREVCRDLKRDIEDYDAAFNLQETDTIESAVMRVDRALEQGLVGSLFRNQFKDFVKEYMDKSYRHLRDLNDYKHALLTQLVFNSIEQAVNKMIDDWKRFFDNLKDTRDSLLMEINQLAVQFEHNNDPTINYVLGTKQMMENMWESLRGSVDQGILPEEISRQIYLSHYRQYCKRNEQTYSNYLQEIRVEELYREHVLGHCRDELRRRYHDRLDLSIIQALRLEGRHLGINPNKHVEEKIGALDQLSLPFIPRIDNHRELKFWGMHTQVKEELGNAVMNQIFSGKEVVDEAFSRYEVVSYRAHYGLTVESFTKFSSGEESDTHKQLPGIYYEAYRKRVDRLNRGESTVTPHLDRYWHVPAFMPDLNQNQVELDTEKNDRALILGLIYGWITLVKDDGHMVYLYDGEDSPTLIRQSGAKVEEETYLLHKALAHNPKIYEEILARFKERTVQDQRRIKTIQEHKFVTGSLDLSHLGKNHVKNIFDVLLSYEREALGDNTLPEKGERLRRRLLEEIEQYFTKIYGKNRENEARKAAASFIDKLWSESIYREELEEESMEYTTWNSLIKNKTDQLLQHN